jgi:hypothetical protein
MRHSILDTDKGGGNDLFGFVQFILSLLEELVETDSTVELLLGSGVKSEPNLARDGDLGAGPTRGFMVQRRPWWPCTGQRNRHGT